MLCNRPHKWGASIISNLRKLVEGLLARAEKKLDLQSFNFIVHFLEQVRHELISQVFEDLKQGRSSMSEEELFESVIVCELKLHQDYINHFMRPVLQRDFSQFVYSVLERTTASRFADASQAQNTLSSMKMLSEHPHVTCIIDLATELESLLHKVTLLHTYKNGIAQKISVMMLFKKALNKDLVKQPLLRQVVFGILGAGFKQAESASRGKAGKDLGRWRACRASILILDIIGYIVQPYRGSAVLGAKCVDNFCTEINLSDYEEFLQFGAAQMQDNKMTADVMIQVRDLVEFHLQKRLKPFNELLCEYIQGVLDGKWSAIQENFESNLQWFFENPDEEVDLDFLKTVCRDVKIGSDEFVLVETLELNSNTQLKDMKTSFMPPKNAAKGKYDI